MQELKTPCYIIDEKKLKENLTILRDLEQKSGCHVLLAQKAFSMYRLYPLMGEYKRRDGERKSRVCASV